MGVPKIRNTILDVLIIQMIVLASPYLGKLPHAHKGLANACRILEAIGIHGCKTSLRLAAKQRNRL